MKEDVNKKLFSEYSNLYFKTKQTCIKYHYQYQNVDVNVFYDAYDIEHPSLALILYCDKKFYYISLNISNNEINQQYLKGIPYNILIKILDKNHTLAEFSLHMNKVILTTSVHPNFYKNEDFFVNTLRYSINRKDLPFLDGIRKVRMTDERLNILHHTLNIDIKILRDIQSHNMTLVRTSDPERRKKLTVILKDNVLLL